ncbi:MAG: glycosyltransferase [Gammaproteobacteria bacterium]|nr:glycosyltransferase [Gammaproteobacteria bacterium]
MNNPAFDSLQIIGSRPSGGAERFYVRLVQSLNAAGHRALAVNQPGSAVSTALGDDYSQHRVRMLGVWDRLARRRFQRLARAHQVRVVQTYMGRATRIYRTSRGGPVHVARLGGFYDLSGYRHADAWVGNTRGICDHLIRGGMPANRVYHIGNFVAIALPPPPTVARARFGLGEDDLVLGFVGRLHPNKGAQYLLEAFARIAPCLRGRTTKLVIAGDGPLAPALKRRAEELNLTNRVVWTGWLTEPGPAYAVMDVFVSPSVHEPLGNVVLEAWACGLPVIATRSQGPLELIEHDTNGVLVPISKPCDLAAAAETLLLDESARQVLGEAGRAALRATHSEGQVTDAYLDLYAELQK